jgi:hypothetical protein
MHSTADAEALELALRQEACILESVAARRLRVALRSADDLQARQMITQRAVEPYTDDRPMRQHRARVAAPRLEHGRHDV